jgi:hypothetical protein
MCGLAVDHDGPRGAGDMIARGEVGEEFVDLGERGGEACPITIRLKPDTTYGRGRDQHNRCEGDERSGHTTPSMR